jgi:CPA2 family monovalent cation:H+ antiporter-2
VILAATSQQVALVFIELGATFVGLALMARLAHRWGISPIPLYLMAGLVFGDGGVVPLDLGEEFIEIGAEIGVLLLLFMLGLEYTAAELTDSLRTQAISGLIDLVFNFTPGLLMGLVLGWSLGAAVLLGGVTYISSSGVISKVLADLNRFGNRETPVVLGILVIEDLVMAVYLPLVAVAFLGGTGGMLSLVTALAVVAVVQRTDPANRHAVGRGAAADGVRPDAAGGRYRAAGAGLKRRGRVPRRDRPLRRGGGAGP